MEEVSTKVSTTFEILMGVLSNYIVQIMYLPIVKFFNLHKFNWRFLHNDVRIMMLEAALSKRQITLL